MKKRNRIALIVLLALCVCLLSGCGKKHIVTVTYKADMALELVSADEGLTNTTAGENSVTTEVKKEGEYHIVVRSGSGQEITVTLLYENGICSVSEDSGLAFGVGMN